MQLSFVHNSGISAVRAVKVLANLPYYRLQALSWWSFSVRWISTGSHTDLDPLDICILITWYYRINPMDQKTSYIIL